MKKKLKQSFISDKRLRESTSQYGGANNAADSDRGRVLFSAPFRRMREKAQVFSLEDNAAVRTRLTHSLEVSHIGRYLAKMLIRKCDSAMLKKIGIATPQDKEAATTIVEVACLLHDIGNPPFGHFGEKVICHWFEKQRTYFSECLNFGGQDKGKDEFEKYYKDFLLFDGNPQGFRIVSKLQWNHDENGLNLTASQLASLLKYDCSPIECSADKPSRKKAGYFLIDEHVINDVWQKLDMKSIRHPLSYLMEAADDLAYCMSDIEDGIEKGLITGNDIKLAISDSNSDLLNNIYKDLKENFDTHSSDQKLRDLQVFLKVKTETTNQLISIVIDKFIISIDEIVDRSIRSIVSLCSEAEAALKVFRDLANKYLYNSRVVRENEILANQVLTGLLDSFSPLLSCNLDRLEDIRMFCSKDRNGNSISVEPALYKQLGSKYVKVYERDSINPASCIKDPRVREWMARAHLIVDHISGMTDKFALNKFRLFCAP